MSTESGDDLEIQFVDDAPADPLADYPWAAGDTQVALRSFIFQTIVDSHDDIIPNLDLMDACYLWIKDAVMPKGKKNGSHLKPVENKN
jgi:hypothetical protein